jgi:hypothetical protein
MGVDLEGKSGALADTLHKAVDGVGGERPAALVWNTKAPSVFRCNSGSTRNSSPRMG